MGLGSSRTRTLTIENENKTSVIKVSQDVVDRLKGCEDEEVKQNNKSVSTIPLDESSLGPLAVPYYYDPRLIYLQIQQEKEDSLKKNDEYWEKRIADLETEHGRMHKVMETEFQKAFEEVNEVKANEEMEPFKFYSPPCQIRRKAVVECYKKYPREPMRCSNEVKQFAECVDVQRATIVSNRS